MTKYNSYAKKLNEAFQYAAEATADALAAYKTAEANRGTKYTGEGEYQRAADNLRKVQNEVWTTFQRTRAALTEQLKAEVAADRLLNPDSVDSNALFLLNSSVATAADIEALAERYADNVTMARLIGGRAKELAATTKDPSAAQRLNAVAHNAESSKTLEAWDGIIGATRYYSGEIHGDMRPESIVGMNLRWNDGSVQNTLKDF